MCGFVGFRNTPEVRSPESVVKAMADRIVHRGPDDADYYVDQDVSLGFRRLSIKDKRKERGEMDECLWKRMLLALRGAFREATSLCSKDTGFFPPGGEQIVNEL